MVGQPRPIPVGQEPPPLRRPSPPTRPNGKSRARGQGKEAKGAKGAPSPRKAANRFAVLNNFVDFALAELNRNEIAVWLVLYRDTRDGIARTSQMDIGRRAGVTDRTVRTAVRRLEGKGLVQVVRRGGRGLGSSSYRVHPLPLRR